MNQSDHMTACRTQQNLKNSHPVTCMFHVLKAKYSVPSAKQSEN